MTPYYEDAGIVLYLGDCREVLPTIAADVVITDPPYNRGKQYGDRVDDARTDYESWCREWFGLLGAATIAFTCGHRNVGMWCRIQDPDWIICWFKPAALSASPFGVCNWEPILFWGDTKMSRGARVDVIRAGILPIPQSTLNGHPCPKPDQWAVGLVEMLSDPRDVVLDPFAGSGTTLVAAKRLGRRAIGIEIEERFCESTARRLSQAAIPFEEEVPVPVRLFALEEDVAP